MRRSMLVSILVAVSGVAVSAWGHGSLGGDFGRRPPAGLRGPRPDGLFQQLVFPCRSECFDASRSCIDTPRAAAVSCAEGVCATEIDAARTACQADPSSADCQSARTALATCAQPCLDALRSALDACQTTLDACLATCGTT